MVSIRWYEALVAHRRNVYTIYFQNGGKTGRLAQLASLAANRGVPLKTVGAAEFKTLVGTADIRVRPPRSIFIPWQLSPTC